MKRASHPDSSCAPVGSALNFRTGSHAGYIVPSVITTGFPGGTLVDTQMRVWEASGGTSYEAAMAAGKKFGTSNTVQLRLTEAPESPPSMIGLAWVSIPEWSPMPPWVSTQPAGVRVAVGNPFTLNVGAVSVGTTPYFQWYRDGQPIVGVDESALSVATAQLADAGNYFVTVTYIMGAATSQVALVVVGYPLTFLSSGPGRIEVEPVSEVYEPRQRVTLKAIPSGGATFEGWGGDLSGTANPAMLIMDGPKAIHAWFALDPLRLDISPDNQRVATGTADGMLLWWDVAEVAKP